MMSERLREMVRNAVVKELKQGVERLAVKAGVSPALVRSVIKRGHVPGPHNVYKLALACGLSEPEALTLARESFPEVEETA